MPRLSILIPYLGNTRLLEDTLVSVLENRPHHSEIVVVLSHRYEDPYDLGDEVRFLQASQRTGLVGCLNLGIGASRAELVHVLACGAEVAEGWAEAAIGHFEDPRVACVAPLVVDARRPQRVVAAGADYHPGGTMQLLHEASPAAQISLKPATVLGPHSAAAFYRKSALERIGRFDAEAGDRLSVLDMAMLLEHTGFRTVLEPRCHVRLAPAALRRVGAFRSALEAERFFWRWAYADGWTRSLALHAVTLAAEGGRRLWRPSILPWVVGRLFGSASIGSHRRFRRRIERAARGAVAAGSATAPHFAGHGAKSARDARATVGRR